MICLALAGLQAHLDVVRAHRRPAIGDGIVRLAGLDRARPVPAAPGPEEILALGVEAFERLRSRQTRRNDCAARDIRSCDRSTSSIDLDLAGREIALEIGGVVIGFPQAEFDRREDRELGRLGRSLVSGELPDFQIFVERHEIARARRRCRPSLPRWSNSPCRGGIRRQSSSLGVGIHEGDQNSPVALSRR